MTPENIQSKAVTAKKVVEAAIAVDKAAIAATGIAEKTTEAANATFITYRTEFSPPPLSPVTHNSAVLNLLKPPTTRHNAQATHNSQATRSPPTTQPPPYTFSSNTEAMENSEHSRTKSRPS